MAGRVRSFIDTSIIVFKKAMEETDDENLKKEYEEQIRKFEKLKEIIEKRKKGELTMDDIIEAQKVTCYGNIGFCCDPNYKKCPYFLSACEALGIDPYDFAKFKRLLTVILLDFLLKPKKST